MTAALPCAVALLWALAVLLAPSEDDFARSRSRYTALLLASAAVTALAWLVVDAGGLRPAIHIGNQPILWTATGFLGAVPMLISVIGLVAICLSDSISHSVGTLKRIMLLLALAMAFVASDEPLVLALVWSLSPIIAWLEIRARPDSAATARLFTIFHIPSAVLFVSSVVALELNLPVWAGVLGLAAVGIREAVIPGHTWFIRFVESAPLGLVVAFVGPQLGVYAHVELLASTIPHDLALIVGAFGAATALIAAWLGLAQTTMRRSLAYFMMSQTGLAAFGLQAGSEVAIAGALVFWQVLAIAASGFAMTISSLEARRGPLDLSHFSGCFSRTPRMAAGFLMMGLASVGFPMTLGFIAEDLLVQGAVMDQPIFAFILIAATALNGMNVMRCFFKLFSGRRVHTGEPDLTKRESRALSVVLLLLLLGGLAPSAITTREFDNAGDAHGQAVIEHRISSIKGASFSRTAASERSR